MSGYSQTTIFLFNPRSLEILATYQNLFNNSIEQVHKTYVIEVKDDEYHQH